MTLRKSVLITGCSRGGLGAAMAEGFLEKGYHVFATVRDPAKVPESLREAQNTTILTLDVLQADSIVAAVASVSQVTNGRLDVLVNNSGGSHIAPGLDVVIRDAQEVFDLNFWGPFRMVQAFSHLLIKAQGCLVNNTSACAYAPFAAMSVYNSSKAALAAASETWRHELSPFGVRVITLITTGVKTLHFDKYMPVETPENSYYYSIRGFLRDLGDGRMQKGAIPAAQYAQRVVREVDRGTTGQVWAGTSAFVLRMTYALAPQFLWDSLVRGIVPLGEELLKVSKAEN